MKRFKEQLSPALALSIAAIFIALGGGAYAAVQANSVGTKQLKNNAVATKKIKKNAVTTAKIRNQAVNTAKIKNNAVTTAKIRNNSVTGAKVNESTLGTVPLATTAGSADNAANAAAVDGYRTFKQTRIGATAGPSFAAASGAAPEVTMFKSGPITVYAKCTTDTSVPETQITVYIKTSENGVVFDSDEDSLDGDADFLNTNTPEADREVLKTDTTANSSSISANSSYATQVFTPSGTSFEMEPGVAVKNGTLVGGNGVYGPGDACLVGANIIERTGG